MATLSFGLQSGVLNGSKNFTLSDADVTRWINAYRAEAQAAKNAATPEGEPNTQVTDAQVLSHWAKMLVERTKRTVKDFEAGATVPTDIVITE